MSRNTRVAVFGVGGVVVVAAAIFAYIFFVRGSGEASVDISEVVSTIAVTPTTEADATPQAAGADADTSAAAAGAVLFTIVPEESEARYIIDEILNNNPFTVVGVTNQVGGQISIDFADPSKTQIGEIVINMRTFRTDNPNRDRAVNGFILNTADHEFSRFLPTSIDGLPTAVTFGAPMEMQIAGDMTVQGTAYPVVFDASITPVSETRIEGLASLVINYADLGVSIPRLPPQVASVEEDMRLELEFVAVAQ
jgi:polyisoprenoid-binding protein YceI